MLFSPESHEPLVDDEWNPTTVEAAIRAIAADAEAAFDDGWPAHPLDEDEPRRFRAVYLGGAGVIRALDDLRRRGLVEVERDYVPYLERDYVADFPEYDNDGRSLLAGETGIRVVLQKLAPSAGNLDRIAELVAANARDERRELMWGSPGTMLVADALHRETGEPRWQELWRESAEALDAEWEPETGVWTQELYGEATRYFGPAHGFAGCMLALAARDGDGDERATAGVRRHAVEEDGLANWPAVVDEALDETGDGRIRMQWCHGAPGVVASLAGLAPADDEHDRLMRAGGELTWCAGAAREGREPLPRHRGQRLRVPRAPAANGRRAVAGACARVRAACGRTGRTRPCGVRAGPLLAVDRRSRDGALPRRLPRGARLAAAAVGARYEQGRRVSPT